MKNEPSDRAPSVLEQPPGDAPKPPPPPLNVSGLVVSKTDMLAVLQYYLAQVSDVRMIDEDHFWLQLGASFQTARP